MNEIGVVKKTIYESEAIIKGNESLIGTGLWNIGNELKTIRDEKSYREKGYDSFEEYAEKELKYGRSHCYNFISIAENYNVQSIGQIPRLGMTKLLSLGQLEENERETFIEENPVEDMTTRELRQAIKDKKELEQEIQDLKNRPIKTIEVEKIVIPEHIKDKLIDLEEDRKELEKLRQAGMDLKEYNNKKLDIDRQMKEKRTEYESLMNTMRRLEQSYDEKNTRLTIQANLLNKVRMGVKPLKELSTEIERLFDLTGELDAISLKEISSELKTAYKVLDLIDSKLQNINVEVIYYEKQ